MIPDIGNVNVNVNGIPVVGIGDVGIGGVPQVGIDDVQPIGVRSPQTIRVADNRIWVVNPPNATPVSYTHLTLPTTPYV